jgi:MFS family permease
MADQPPGGAPQPRHDAYAAFREPAFRRFTFCGLFVQVAVAAQSIAIAYELYKRTNDAWAIAMVGLVTALPLIIFTLPAGYMADVMDRRKIMLVGMAGTSLTSIGLAIFSWMEGSIPWMYVLLFLDAAALQFAGPSRAAFVTQLVPIGKLENAMKWRSTFFQLAAVLGPAVGGLVMMYSIPATYLLSATSTLSMMVVVATIRVAPAPRAQRGDMIKRVTEGLHFVWSRPVLLGTISLDLFAVLLGGAVYLLPMFVEDGIIHLEGTGIENELALGLLRAAPAVGAMLTAVVVAHMPPFKKAGRTMLVSVALFGVATIAFGYSRNLWLSLLMLALTGAFDMVSVVVRHTLVHLLTPNEMRGRVSAVNSIFIGSSNEIGGFRAGGVAAYIGAVNSTVLGGVCTLAVVGAWAGLFPRLRQFGSMADAVAEQGGIDTMPDREPQDKQSA